MLKEMFEGDVQSEFAAGWFGARRTSERRLRKRAENWKSYLLALLALVHRHLASKAEKRGEVGVAVLDSFD